MPSLIALTGVNVDRPYPELGADAADRRRSVATTLLLAAISRAQELNVDALVFVGGLFDYRYVSPLSVGRTAQILDAYPGVVLIASGADPEGVYSSTSWGPRTFLWPSTNFAGAPAPFDVVLGRAVERGWATKLPALSSGDNMALLVDLDLDFKTATDWVGGCRKRHVVTSGSEEVASDGVTVLAPVNPDLGAPWGQAALLTYDDAEVTCIEWLSLTEKASAETVDVDVAEFRTTGQLLSAVDRAVAAAPEWSVINLTGNLPQGVMLPTTAEHVCPRADVTIRTNDVGFAFTPPDQGDHSALAEFVRSLCDADAEPRARHQAIALGIAALDPTSVLVNES